MVMGEGINERGGVGVSHVGEWDESVGKRKGKKERKKERIGKIIIL